PVPYTTLFRSHGHVRGGGRGGVGADGAVAGAGAAALDQQDRLLAADPAGDAGELARVAERLQVQGDDVGVRVVLPVFEQVVAAHVGLVADRDEHGHVQPFQQRGGDR